LNFFVSYQIFLPQYEGITIDFDCQFKVHLKDSRISTILAALATLLPQLLMDFFQKVLFGSALANMQWLSRKNLLPASLVCWDP
jgi:hypothetical protein